MTTLAIYMLKIHMNANHGEKIKKNKLRNKITHTLLTVKGHCKKISINGSNNDHFILTTENLTGI